MDTTIGPFSLEVIVGLKKVRFVLEPNEHGVSFDLTFTGSIVADARAAPLHPADGPHHLRHAALRADGVLGRPHPRRRRSHRREGQELAGHPRPLVGRPAGRASRSRRGSSPTGPARDEHVELRPDHVRRLLDRLHVLGEAGRLTRPRDGEEDLERSEQARRVPRPSRARARVRLGDAPDPRGASSRSPTRRAARSRSRSRR